MSKMKDAWFDEYWNEIWNNGKRLDGNSMASSHTNYELRTTSKVGSKDTGQSGFHSDLPRPNKLVTGTEKFYLDVMNESDEAIDILLKKHEDYGPENIARAPGGALNGLAVRLHDKVARLAHLLETGKSGNYESMRDTFIDISNYGIIGMMVLDGVWDGADNKKEAQ